MRRERAFKILFACACLLPALGLICPNPALAASKKKYVGCVVNGKLHCAYKNPNRVEILTVPGSALMGYEGKKVQVEGKLNTYDNSLIGVYSSNVKLIGPCDKETKRAISGYSPPFQF